MRILFWQLGVFGESAVERAFQLMNIELIVHKQPLQSLDSDKSCVKTLSEYLFSWKSTLEKYFGIDL